MGRNATLSMNSVIPSKERLDGHGGKNAHQGPAIPAIWQANSSGLGSSAMPNAKLIEYVKESLELI